MQVAAEGVSFEVRSGPNDWFWGEVNAGRWEPHTLSALHRLLGPGKVFVDVGTWIGPTALAAAAFGAEVYAYEPDPVALDVLQANLDLNPALAGRIFVHPLALSDRTGMAFLSASKLGNSMSSLAAGRGDKAAVPVLDVRRAIREGPFPRAAMVKVDIEGGEYAILPALKKHLQERGTPLLLSLHTHHLIEAARGLPAPIRWMLLRVQGIVLKWRATRSLDFYWIRYVPSGSGWRQVGRLRAKTIAVRTGGVDLLFCQEPL